MNVQSWTGYDDPRFGYGSMHQGFKKALPAGVSLDPCGSVNVHMSVPNVCRGWLQGQHRVLFTMWETDTLPRSFVRWLGQYDQILVPCTHNVGLFSQHHSDVKLVTLGVDRFIWKPRTRPDNPVFRFAAGGSLWHRKGLDIVVKAFQALNLPNTELHIKAAPHAADTPTTPLGPNVFLHRQWMTEQETVTWFHQADCFIAASRGEGFGLMPLQAISAGIPTILSTTTGQTEFAHLATYQIPCGTSPAPTIGNWDEPNLDALIEAMRDAYNNKDRNNQTAKTKASRASEYSWGKATKQLLAAVPTGTLLPADTPHVAPTVTVDVTPIRNIKADIGPRRWELKAGVTYTVPEGVYQVLSDAGTLQKNAVR